MSEQLYNYFNIMYSANQVKSELAIGKTVNTIGMDMEFNGAWV
jgi:hypothetical protein